MAERPTILISYSQKDEIEKDRLLAHLGVLQAGGLIELWSEDQVGPGTDWQAELEKTVVQAEVAFLMITAQFLYSKFISEKLIPALLKRQKEENLILIPLLTKSCPWRTVSWLAKLIIRPRERRPIWRDGDIYID